MTDILKRVEELSDLFDNTGSERLEFSSGKRVGFRDEGLARFANPGLGKGILKRAKERRQFVKQGLLDDYSDFLKNRKLFVGDISLKYSS